MTLARNLGRRDREVLGALGRAVRRERALKGLSQERVAVQAGLFPQHLSRIERAEVDVRLTTLARLAEALGVTVGHLVDGGRQ